MTVFSEAELAYLESKTMGRLATIGADGRPHLVPLTYRFNAWAAALGENDNDPYAGVVVGA